MISKSSPVSDPTSSWKASALLDRRQASVATHRIRLTPLRRIFFMQIFSAAMVRDMASEVKHPFVETPSPRRTIRENASTTLKPNTVGRAIKRRQLLVPKSIAA
jgi:hypothetical protein